LTGWSGPEAIAEWRLPANHRQGGYIVELTYSTASQPQGKIVIRETFYTLTRLIQPGTPAGGFRSKAIGILRMRSNSPALRVTGHPDNSGGPLPLQIKQVRLLAADAAAK
jgi:hypothetical protein